MLNWQICVLISINFSKSHQFILNSSQRMKPEGFIVGGRYADIHDYPHSAFLAISCLKDGAFEEFACGSSILNQMVLLTAAHCFEGCMPGTKISGCVGEANKRKKKVLQISSFISHPMYDGNIMRHDIALALMTAPLHFGKLVKRVILPRTLIENEPATLAGWGVTNEEYVTDTLFLKTTKQIVWNRQKCMTVFPKLSEGFFCATGDLEQNDYGYAAVGDSGSALIVRNFVQIGIVSHKIADVSKSLIVYTDVAYYFKWIEITSRALYCRAKLKRGLIYV